MENAALTPSVTGRLNQNHLSSGTKDKPRERPLVRMKVHNRDTLALTLPGANIISPGTQEIVCYDDQVDSIRDMVEDPKKIAQAEQQYAVDIAEQVGRQLEPQWERGIEELVELIATGADAKVNEVYARVSQTTGLSKQGAFQKLFKRAMKPLSMAELIPNSEHAEWQRAGTQREVEKHASAFAMALREVARDIVTELRGSAAPSEDKIAALVDARVKEMLGEKAKR